MEIKDSKKAKDFTIDRLKEEITDDMTDKQKYKIIFDYFVNTYKYDYSILDQQKAFDYLQKAFSTYRNVLRTYIKNIDNYDKLSNFERTEKIMEQIPRNEENKEILEIMEKAYKYYFSAQQFENSSENYKYGNLFETHYGICQNFSLAFKEICDEFGLPCESIGGQILSDGINLGHAWNAIAIDEEIRFIDISSALHSKDGTYPNNKPEDFFNVNWQQLVIADNGKNRALTEASKEKIEEMKRKMHPFNPNGGGDTAIQNTPKDTQNLDSKELELD